MKKTSKIKRIQERMFSAHHMLLDIGRVGLDRAKNQDFGWQHDALTSLLFSALAIESLANTIGEKRVKNWSDFESAKTAAKLRIIASETSVNYKGDVEPWSTAVWLFRLRNFIVHAKPQVIKKESILTQQEYDSQIFDRPESKLESDITIKNAERALIAASTIKDLLCQGLSYEDSVGISWDGWIGSESTLDEID